MKKLHMLDGTVLTPLGFECPACFSKANKPCTNATETGRRDVPWFHLAREANLDIVAASAHLQVVDE